jgi:hypothetical protein
MNLVLSSSLSKEWMLTGHSSSSAPQSPSSLAVSRRSEPRISSCSAPRQSKASFGCGFSPCKLNRAKPLAGGAVWKLSPGPADHRDDQTGHLWVRIDGILLQYGSRAMIFDLASALSANWTDHFCSASQAGMMTLSPVFDAIMPVHAAATNSSNGVRHRASAQTARIN